MRFVFTIFILFMLLSAGCAAGEPVATPLQSITPGVDEPGGVCSIDPQSTCAAPAGELPTPDVTETGVQPVLYGTWSGEDGQGKIRLTVSETTVDLVIAPVDGGGTTQMQYTIQHIDWAKDLITLVLTSEVVVGEEFPVNDTPVYMKVWIDNEVLYFSIEEEPPVEATIGPLKRE